MPTRLRSTVAAALLLAPLAASFAAPPAASAAAPAAAPTIANMSLNSDAGLSPGATLRVQVTTTRDARAASVALGDSGVTVPLHQQAPGTYTGTYVVRRKDQIDPMQMMTARVTVGDRSYSRQFNFPPGFQALQMGAAAADRDEADARPAPRDPRRERYGERVAARDPARDQRSPDITDLLPGNGDQVGTRHRVHVGARLSDDGSGVDPASVRLRLNGEDVTADSRISPDAVHFRGDLPPGHYTAEVTARDQIGNRTTKAWGFDVVPDDRFYGDERPRWPQPPG